MFLWRVRLLLSCRRTKKILDDFGEGLTAPEALGLGILFANSHADFQQMLIDIATHGGDTDTIASIAGNIWGAVHGVNKLNVFCERLLLKDEIQSIAYRY